MSWHGLDSHLTEDFWLEAQRMPEYNLQVTLPKGVMLYCRNCQEVAFYRFWPVLDLIIKGSGQIRVQNGVSVRIISGTHGVARWGEWEDVSD
jgi:hypothetical protein